MLDPISLSLLDQSAPSVIASNRLSEGGEAPYFVYEFECRDAEGNVKWSETVRNLVTTAGKNDLLDKYFAGSAYTAGWFMGLVDNASFTAIAAADTMASHAGWIESVVYSNATRPAIAFAAASGGTKVTSAAVAFNINGAATINGVFVNSVNTKSGTTGILYSAGSFSGTRAVSNGDTLNVQLTLQA